MKEPTITKGIELRIAEDVLREVDDLLKTGVATTDSAGVDWYGPLKTLGHIYLVVYKNTETKLPKDAIKLPEKFGAAYLMTTNK